MLLNTPVAAPQQGPGGALRVLSRRGGRLPLHATGVGKVLLAFAPAEVADEVIAAGLPRYTGRTVVVPGHLRRALAEVRRAGLAHAYEELTVGSLTVAAPILGPVLSFYVLGIAYGISLLIGLLAGCHPAARAARLCPMDALRHLCFPSQL